MAFILTTTLFYVSIRSIPIVIHCFGIYLLWKVKYIKRYNRNQGFYIMWLSIIEILMNLTKISIKLTTEDSIRFYMDMVRTGVLACQLTLVLSAMTIDRVGFVMLNLKYRSSWMAAAPRWVLLSACALSCSVTVVLFLCFDTASDFEYSKKVYFWPITDSVVVLTFIVSYTFMKLYVKRRAKSLKRKQSLVLRKKSDQATKVPQLIVSCFITFWVSSNLIYMMFAILEKKIPLLLDGVLNICICVSYSLDANFYIFFCRPIRKHLKNKFPIWKKNYVKEDNSIDEIEEEKREKIVIDEYTVKQNEEKVDKNEKKVEQVNGVSTPKLLPSTIYDIAYDITDGVLYTNN